MKPILAVLYDFDGTLADTTELLLRSFRHTMGAHLGTVLPDSDWISGFGTTLEAQMARFARDAEESAAMIETYRTFQRAHHDELVRPFPGAASALAALRERKVRVAVVTSKYREGVLHGMQLCGLLEHVEVLVTPEDVTHGKPHPEPVHRALTTLGVAAGEALFVGDSPHDIEAGRAAGTRTAAVEWGPFPRATIEVARPDYWLTHHADILKLVGDVSR